MEFRRFDKSRDGRISSEEFYNLKGAANQVHSNNTKPSAGDIFVTMDSNADGFISLKEFRFDLVRNTIAWPAKTFSNQLYKKVGDKLLLMDILMPTIPVHKRAPVLYFVHGGGFRSGAKEYLRLNDLRMETALQFAARGYCCVSVSYRLTNVEPGEPIVLIRDCVTDAWDGLRFLKENAEKYNIDPDNIFVWGESAGGHIAQMLTFSNSEDFPGDPELAKVMVKPAAGMSWYGVSDFTGAPVLEAGNSEKSRHHIRITGKNTYLEDDIETLREVSPYFLLKKDSPPLLLMQGDSDHAVHVSHATHINERSIELGAKLELLIVKNAGHNWRQVGDPIEPTKTEIRNAMLKFAESKLN